MQLRDSRTFTIAVSKSCCPVCWDIIDIFNKQDSESGVPVRFNARGRHPTLYPVDLPEILDDGIKDELLKKFSITLIKDLVSLLENDAKVANAKHVSKDSNVSQPESVAFSLDSSDLGGSIDVDSSEANQAYVAEARRKMDSNSYLERVTSWDCCNLNYLGDKTVSKV
jgi:hypothetical protein